MGQGLEREVLAKYPLNTQELVLRGAKNLTVIPESLFRFHNLRKLHLDYNKLTSVPPEMFLRLPHLTFLSLSYNQLDSIPAEIKHCTNLQYLFLDNNLLTEIPAELCVSLTNLRTLLLYNNRIRELPYELCFLTQLQQLRINGNAEMVVPPREIAKQGPEIILRYMRELRSKSSKSIYNIRLVVTGECGSGKTSLLNVLFSGKSSEQQQQHATLSPQIYRWEFIQHVADLDWLAGKAVTTPNQQSSTAAVNSGNPTTATNSTTANDAGAGNTPMTVATANGPTATGSASAAATGTTTTPSARRARWTTMSNGSNSSAYSQLNSFFGGAEVQRIGNDEDYCVTFSPIVVEDNYFTSKLPIVDDNTKNDRNGEKAAASVESIIVDDYNDDQSNSNDGGGIDNDDEYQFAASGDGKPATNSNKNAPQQKQKQNQLQQPQQKPLQRVPLQRQQNPKKLIFSREEMIVNSQESVLRFIVYDLPGRLSPTAPQQLSSLFYESQHAIHLVVFDPTRFGNTWQALDHWIATTVAVTPPSLPIVVVATKQDLIRNAIPREAMQSLCERYPQVERCFVVSAKDHTGIRDLKRYLMRCALRHPKTLQHVPIAYVDVFYEVEQMQYDVENYPPIIDWTTLRQLISTETHYDLEAALEMLHEWGFVISTEPKRLRRNSLFVLQPDWFYQKVYTITSPARSLVTASHCRQSADKNQPASNERRPNSHHIAAFAEKRRKRFETSNSETQAHSITLEELREIVLSDVKLTAEAKYKQPTSGRAARGWRSGTVTTSQTSPTHQPLRHGSVLLPQQQRYSPTNNVPMRNNATGRPAIETSDELTADTMTSTGTYSQPLPPPLSPRSALRAMHDSVMVQFLIFLTKMEIIFPEESPFDLRIQSTTKTATTTTMSSSIGQYLSRMYSTNPEAPLFTEGSTRFVVPSLLPMVKNYDDEWRREVRNALRFCTNELQPQAKRSEECNTTESNTNSSTETVNTTDDVSSRDGESSATATADGMAVYLRTFNFTMNSAQPVEFFDKLIGRLHFFTCQSSPLLAYRNAILLFDERAHLQRQQQQQQQHAKANFASVFFEVPATEEQRYKPATLVVLVFGNLGAHQFDSEISDLINALLAEHRSLICSEAIACPACISDIVSAAPSLNNEHFEGWSEVIGAVRPDAEDVALLSMAPQHQRHVNHFLHQHRPVQCPRCFRSVTLSPGQRWTPNAVAATSSLSPTPSPTTLGPAKASPQQLVA